MGDFIETKRISVEVQANGIIRDAAGNIIARLIREVEFSDLTDSGVLNIGSDGEGESNGCSRLRAENERVRLANVDCVDWTLMAREDADTLRAERDALRGQVKEMRKAGDDVLARLLNSQSPHHDDCLCDGCTEVQQWHEATSLYEATPPAAEEPES